MIDGLRLRFSGDELRRLLKEREAQHRASVAASRAELNGESDASDEAVRLPAHMVEDEIERHDWRARVLAFVGEHIDPAETYSLAAHALAFVELLPPPPAGVVHERWQERAGLTFAVERLTAALTRCPDAPPFSSWMPHGVTDAPSESA